MSKNKQLLIDFQKYCEEHPEQRFWQALRNWAEIAYIMAGDLTDPEYKINTLKDTFYWENKTD